MTIEPDSRPSARLERLLRVDAARAPAGLAARVFEASVSHLPVAAVPVVARLSFRWIAAAAALALASGVALRLGTASSVDEPRGHASVAGVIDAADDASFGQDMRDIVVARDGDFTDLDHEMARLLAPMRVDG